jgi:hypothetical protein
MTEKYKRMRWVARLMLLEGLINVVSGLVYMFRPLALLGFLRFPDHHGFNVSEMSVWGMFGTVVISQAVFLFAGGFARGPGAVAMRRAAYTALIVGELLIVPLAVIYINRFGEWNVSAFGFVGSMSVFLVARVWVLYFASPALLADSDSDKQSIL